MSTQENDEIFLNYRQEIIDYHKEMYDFHKNEDDVSTILVKISAMSARVSWIRAIIIKSTIPYYNRLRIDHIDPCLTAIDMQFKIWSRYDSVRKNEYDISKGQE